MRKARDRTKSNQSIHPISPSSISVLALVCLWSRRMRVKELIKTTAANRGPRTSYRPYADRSSMAFPAPFVSLMASSFNVSLALNPSALHPDPPREEGMWAQSVERSPTHTRTGTGPQCTSIPGWQNGSVEERHSTRKSEGRGLYCHSLQPYKTKPAARTLSREFLLPQLGLNHLVGEARHIDQPALMSIHPDMPMESLARWG